MKKCPKCQHVNANDANFCMSCGESLANVPKEEKKTVIEHINNYVGNEKPAQLNWKVLFSDVLKKRSLDDAEEIFIAGTKTTTPEPKDITSNWPHPWLYSRALLACLIAFAIMLCGTLVFNNGTSIPGVIILGTFAIPVAILILFMEMNVFRDVSFYEISKFFLIGGCASILLTLILEMFVSTEYLTSLTAIIIGVTEELAKLLIVFFFIRKTPYRSILAGLLIGASVGAGFAAFESAGYALNSFYTEGEGGMLFTIALRALLAPGGHVAWAAISGAALMIAAKGGNITPSLMVHPKFLRLFIIPVICHSLWDMPWVGLIGYVGLLIFIWIIVMLFFNMGLNEAERVANEANMPQEEVTDTEIQA